jgi:hypothetical protein
MRYLTLGEVVKLHRAVIESSGGATGLRGVYLFNVEALCGRQLPLTRSLRAPPWQVRRHARLTARSGPRGIGPVVQAPLSAPRSAWRLALEEPRAARESTSFRGAHQSAAAPFTQLRVTGSTVRHKDWQPSDTPCDSVQPCKLQTNQYECKIALQRQAYRI